MVEAETSEAGSLSSEPADQNLRWKTFSSDGFSKSMKNFDTFCLGFFLFCLMPEDLGMEQECVRFWRNGFRLQCRIPCLISKRVNTLGIL